MHRRSEDDAHRAELAQALADPTGDPAAFERDKIQGAVRTDFILSAEIIAISLGTVTAASFGMQVAVLAGIAILMTIGVYGLLAGIVKLDDGGLYLSRKAGNGFPPLLYGIGRGILRAAPVLMKTLSVIGTAAMFLVGGGILIHGMAGAHDLIHAVTHAAEALPAIGGILATFVPLLIDTLAGSVAGALLLGGVTTARRLFG